MLKKFIIVSLFVTIYSGLQAQDNVYPAGPQKGTLVIKNGTVYTATGNVIHNGAVVIKDGKITEVGTTVSEEAGATIIDAKGKNVSRSYFTEYRPGAQRNWKWCQGSNDYFELGEYNPSVRSIVAYNTDSKIINTLRANGILLACVVPQGRLITGSSSVVQLDAWTWQDAIYKADNGLHINMPMLMRSPRRSFRTSDASDPVKAGIQTIEEVESFFLQAQAYFKQPKKRRAELEIRSVEAFIRQKQKLFVHADIARQILVAVDFSKKFNIDVVLVGGSDSYLFADLLRQNNIAVILNSLHSLPTMQDDDIDQPFKTPAILQKQGAVRY